MTTPKIPYGQQIIEASQKFNSTPALANANVSKVMQELNITQDDLIGEVAEAFANVLVCLGIDTENDHNTQGTAKRVAKMFVNEVYKGRYTEAPEMTTFPNAKNVKDMFTLGPIRVQSACSHHLVPIVGEAWVGIIPNDKVLGISKYHRIVDHIMRRPQIQEESAEQVADMIQDLTGALDVAFVVRAQHMCMTWRGVNAPMESSMVSTVLRGKFKEAKVKAEFLSTIKGQGF